MEERNGFVNLRSVLVEIDQGYMKFIKQIYRNNLDGNVIFIETFEDFVDVYIRPLVKHLDDNPCTQSSLEDKMMVHLENSLQNKKIFVSTKMIGSSKYQNLYFANCGYYEVMRKKFKRQGTCEHYYRRLIFNSVFGKNVYFEGQDEDSSVACEIGIFQLLIYNAELRINQLMEIERLRDPEKKIYSVSKPQLPMIDLYFLNYSNVHYGYRIVAHNIEETNRYFNYEFI